MTESDSDQALRGRGDQILNDAEKLQLHPRDSREPHMKRGHVARCA